MGKKLMEHIKQPELTGLIYLYRYISLLCTSFVYFTTAIDHTAERKLFIIICIIMSSVILNRFYLKNKGATNQIMLLLLIETVGNIVLLIPSGGINSPYIWHCANTILIASVELKKRYCWANLFIYLLVINWIPQITFKNNIVEMLIYSLNISLSLMLITVAMQLLAKYIRDIEDKSMKLSLANEQLNKANDRIKKSMCYIMELYNTINLFSMQNDKAQVIKLILQYAKKITMSNTVFFHSTSGNKELIIETDEKHEIVKEKLTNGLSELSMKHINKDLPVDLEIGADRYLLMLVKSDYMIYGVLGIEMALCLNSEDNIECIEQLKILSGLSSIVLEKIDLEKVNGRLLVAEEQNRIASEIHDSVLQRLFNISCSIFTLNKQQKDVKRNNISYDLSIIQDTIRSIMKDLRTVIYGLSWQKNGSDNFIVDLKKRINEIRMLSGSDIIFNVKGDTSLLGIFRKKALYRIICEAIGNSIRHGKASEIHIELAANHYETTLSIIDNGCGFDVNKSDENENKGIGLSNIHQLAYSLNGRIDFNSVIGKGTEIFISFANNSLIKEKIV